MISLSPDALQTQPQWYALYVLTRHEKRVAEHLVGKGIETFLPVYRTMRLWKNRTRVELDLPLFPGYLFVHIFPTNRVRVSVLQSPGALSLVGSGGNPVAIHEREIESLQASLRLQGTEPHPYLKMGERVRIVAGPLQGREGVLVRIKNKYRVVLSIDIIMRSVAVEIDLCDLEQIRAAPRLVSNAPPAGRALNLGTCGI